jgi:hypothetical protein
VVFTHVADADDADADFPANVNKKLKIEVAFTPNFKLYF